MLEISFKFYISGAIENARPDIARPYSKGGHRETCFSVPSRCSLQVYVWCREYYM